MDVRIEMRKKDFKKTFDDPRRRREEQQLQIRKQNRETRLTTKRQAALAFAESDGADINIVTPQELLELDLTIKGLLSVNPQEQFTASQKIRRLLSIEKDPPIQQVIDANVVPRLVEFLKDDSRPDLQFEAAWALTNIVSGNQDQTLVVIENGALPVFIHLLSSSKDDVREQAVWALGNIAGDCYALRDLVLSQGGLQPLLSQITSAIGNSSKLSLLKNASWTLSNLCRGKPRPQLEWVASALPVLRDLIYTSDIDVLTDSCWSLSYLTDGDSSDQDTHDAIDGVLHCGVAARLIQLLLHPSTGVQTPALRTVGNIVSGSESQTEAMVASGCVAALRVLLNSSKRLIRKEACWTVSNITAGTKKQIQRVIDEGLFPILVQMSKVAEFEIKKEVYWALANAASGANRNQVEYLVRSRIISPLCDILELDNELKLVGAALEALDNILGIGKIITKETGAEENPYVTLVEEADGFPKLEKLQYLSNESRAYQYAIKIMTTYMQVEEDEDDLQSGENPHFEELTTDPLFGGEKFNFSRGVES